MPSQFDDQLTRSTLLILSWFTGPLRLLAWSVVLLLLVYGFLIGLSI